MNNNFNFENEFTSLVKYFNESFSNFFSTNNANSKMYNAFEYAIDGGGKRIRPMLTMLAAGAVSNIDNSNENMDKCSIIPALAIEILHNFTLIHDDIMDNSPIRHGMPTVYKKWNIETAILTGDLMIGYAFKVLQSNSSINPMVINKLTTTLYNSLIEVCEGQEMDIDFNSAASVSMEEYLQMIKLKTSSLLRCAVKLGGIVVNANENMIVMLDNYAIALGIAFQIQDDILDFNANNKKFGKKIGQDIFERKKSYPIIKAKELATDNIDIDFINNYYNNISISTDEEVKKFIELFNKLNVLQIAEDTITFYIQQAKDSISFLPKNNYSKMLEWLLYYILKRNY